MSSEESTVVDARAPTSGVERRIVTVLFADLVGFTSLSERLDPEDVATIQDAYFGSVRETVGRYGGQLEKFIGDAAMAVFGVPRARDDDAERAARAGLALVAAVGQLGARLGVDAGALRLRVGLNTGEVVHATDGPDAGRVTGDTVNTAARLQAAADPSSVFVSEQTALAIAEAFELDAVPPLALKGKAEPVAARRIVAARAHRSRELAMGGLRAPTVGREPELALLRDRIAAVAQQGAAERWLVVAPPGVGKTRLVDEVAATVAAGGDRRTLVGRLRVRPETTDPFDPLRPFARDLLAAAGLDRPGRDELTRALESRGLRGPRAAVVADELLALAAVEAERAPGSHGSGPLDRDARFDAWLDGFDALAGRTSQVWIVEDVHWAGPDLVALLDAATDRPAPGGRSLLVTARPSFVAGTPAWAEDGDARHVLQLPTLGAPDAAGLVGLLVGDALPPELVERIVERSDGNCLFIEELLRTWVGTGALVPVDLDGSGGMPGARAGRWRLTVAAADVPLPSTVQAIYAAQLDDLPPEARLAARRGAVAGRRFPVDALATLGVAAPSEAVDELARRSLVRGPFDEPLAGTSFSYRHALLRDAAYASLARAERAELHVRLARWLEAAAGGRQAPAADAVAAVVGDHLSNAVASAPALATVIAPGLDRATAAAEASAWLERGGARALAEGAIASAADLFRRAVDLTPPDAPSDLARRLTRLGRAVGPIGGVDEAEDAFRRAVDAARRAREAADESWRDRFAEAIEALGALLFERIRFVEAWHLGEAALAEMGDADDLPAARVRLARSRGRTGEQNDATGWVEDAERAVATAAALGDDEAEYEFRSDLVRARAEAGIATADDWTGLAARSRARGDAAGEVTARIMEAGYRLMERPADGPPILVPAREIAVARGLTERLGWIEHATAEAALGSGDWDLAVASGTAALELGERHGYDRIAVRALAALLPVASFRGLTPILERADRWFAARAGNMPDSPYGRVLRAAATLSIAAGGFGPADLPHIDDLRRSIPEWLAQGGFEWLASCDAILDAWFATGRLAWVAEVVGDAPRLAKVGDPSPATPLGLELHAIRLAASRDGSPDELAGRARAVAAGLRAIGARFWVARALSVLELLGRATDPERVEREGIERRLGLVRPILA